MGIASGYATLGSVGFERRKEYSVIGTVPTLACRLCDEAVPGQILISQRVVAALEECVDIEPLGVRPLKGFHKPVTVFELTAWRDPRAAAVQAGEAAP
jgi:adenylate cyclase